MENHKIPNLKMVYFILTSSFAQSLTVLNLTDLWDAPFLVFLSQINANIPEMLYRTAFYVFNIPEAWSLINEEEQSITTNE